MSRPVKTVTIDQSFFVEALTSSVQPSNYLDYFPENIYNVSPNSRLAKLLQVLLGPTGVQFLKTNYYEARKIFEDHGMGLDQLDKFYGNPFRFPRDLTESYSENTDGVLTYDQWQAIRSGDESYRNRAIDYFHAVRLGPTVKGMEVAARSALGYEARVIEGYHSLFNNHSDQILNFKENGNPNKDGHYHLQEFTIVPNNNVVKETANIESQKQHLLKTAIENIKPVNSIQTNKPSLSDSTIVNSKASASTSEFYGVTRFVTGNSDIPWPTSIDSQDLYNSIYWIESGIEKESVRHQNDFQQHYQGFHIPAKITPSTISYGTFDRSFTDKFEIIKLANSYATSTATNGTGYPWKAELALIEHPESLAVTSKNPTTNTDFIQYIYPIEYKDLNNAPSQSYNPTRFWASEEATSGAEYLEIDLGSTKAVNFIVFEALKLPIDIKIEYDVSGIEDSTGIQKSYQVVTPDPLYPTNNSLNYDPSTINRWELLPYIFTDSNEDIIFTRFIKITFTRKNTTAFNGSRFLIDYADGKEVSHPWPVIIKNLKIGRNV